MKSNNEIEHNINTISNTYVWTIMFEMLPKYFEDKIN